jgi:hypothetical protein
MTPEARAAVEDLRKDVPDRRHRGEASIRDEPECTWTAPVHYAKVRPGGVNGFVQLDDALQGLPFAGSVGGERVFLPRLPDPKRFGFGE